MLQKMSPLKWQKKSASIIKLSKQIAEHVSIIMSKYIKIMGHALFYANYGMVESPDPRWLQGAFIILVGQFDKVGLQNNDGKTVSIICRPCHVAGTQLEAAYGRRMTGEGTSYWER